MLKRKLKDNTEKIFDNKIHGIPIIDEKSDWDIRLKLLQKTINKWLNVIPIKEITIEYLFFNE